MTQAKYEDGDWRKPIQTHQRPTELNEGQLRLLDFVTDAAPLITLDALATEIGVVPQTLQRWKKTPLFVAAWNKRLAEMNVSPERTQKMIETAYDIATGAGDDVRTSDRLKAAELYMKFVDRIAPTRIVLDVDIPLSDLSDAEIADRLEEKAANARKRAGAIDVASRELPIQTGPQLLAQLARDAR